MRMGRRLGVASAPVLCRIDLRMALIGTKRAGDTRASVEAVQEEVF